MAFCFAKASQDGILLFFLTSFFKIIELGWTCLAPTFYFLLFTFCLMRPDLIMDAGFWESNSQ
jgi:hypothetical protein